MSRPLRTLIVDDEPPARRRLRALLRAEPDVEVIGEAGDGPAAVDAIAHAKPDLVFLDVQMPGRDGFEVIEEISVRNHGRCPAVIFVTAFDRYAVKAFEVHAVDYLLKPFDRGRLHQAVARASTAARDVSHGDRLLAVARDATGHLPLRRLLVRTSGRIWFVDAADIDWIEAVGHYVSLHVGPRSHVIRESLGHLASRLEPGRFARIHRGALVNILRIKELRPLFHGEFDVVLKDDTRLRATRTYSATLTGAITTAREA